MKISLLFINNWLHQKYYETFVKKKKSILGNKLQNQSLEHRYIPTKIQTPSRGFKKKAQEVEYHKLIIATLYN